MTIEPSTEPNSDVDVGPSADVDAASRFFVEAFADENRRNPYPLYQRMRDLGPIVSTLSLIHI